MPPFLNSTKFIRGFRNGKMMSRAAARNAALRSAAQHSIKAQPVLKAYSDALIVKGIRERPAPSRTMHWGQVRRR
jgi:hypothetical protein